MRSYNSILMQKQLFLSIWSGSEHMENLKESQVFHVDKFAFLLKILLKSSQCYVKKTG